MIKKVRIENADISDHVLMVQVWSVNEDGTDGEMLSETELPNPTDMVEEYVYKEQKLVIVEKS